MTEGDKAGLKRILGSERLFHADRQLIVKSAWWSVEKSGAGFPLPWPCLCRRALPARIPKRA